ncbi:pimeloyl-ACP methyl ester carboxylesterase [Deinococcus metalli]|uniref:Hydrolase n=1 Tax=Deinococcus metalli TaxID=1141878 RepID=A0A7W8NRR3_9DEIO|nr:alpha/beta fold hydrolase [Deinococcus metalli]MBB5376402.1 pimeloyl-ACP methyl ester carboxylesterase [Deinococcus metalli]GHF44336.1 hydrolase [Deinococcus metalli]
MTTLLLPGTLCDASLWAGVALPPRSHALPVVRGDTLADAAGRAVAAMDGPLHVVGFSLGALVAFEILRRSPQRVARVTLISANPHTPTPAQLDAWAGQQRATEAGEFEQVARQLSGGAGAHAPTVLDMARRVGAATFLEQLALLRSRPDSRAVLAAYGGPLTLLVGADDTVTPPALTVEMAALTPHADVRVIPGAGHYLPLDAPRAVSDALRAETYA